MKMDYLPFLQSFTSINLQHNSIFWGDAISFQQRAIMICFCISADYVKTSLTSVVDHIAVGGGKVCIFTTSKYKSFQLVSKLESKLNEAGIEKDIVQIHRDLDKNVKFWMTCAFCSWLPIEDMSLHILIGTGAINVGIDNHSIDFVVIFGWKQDLLTYSQEHGRGSQDCILQSTTILYGNINLVAMFFVIFFPPPWNMWGLMLNIKLLFNSSLVGQLFLFVEDCFLAVDAGGCGAGIVIEEGVVTWATTSRLASALAPALGLALALALALPLSSAKSLLFKLFLTSKLASKSNTQHKSFNYSEQEGESTHSSPSYVCVIVATQALLQSGDWTPNTSLFGEGGCFDVAPPPKLTVQMASAMSSGVGGGGSCKAATAEQSVVGKEMVWLKEEADGDVILIQYFLRVKKFYD